MSSQELLYDINSIAITGTLFVLIILFNEFGFRIGRFVQHRTDEEIKSLTGAIQASVLGLLALLLGFSFNMSMQRHDGRTHALVDEANAIGTAVLRARLLPESVQGDVEAAFREYIEIRIAMGKIDLSRTAERNQYNREVARLQAQLWALAVAAANEDPRPVTSGSFMTALNALIDTQGTRHALLQTHVPEVVLFLLFIVFIVAGGMLGYSTGLSGKRVVIPSALVGFLIALIVFIIIDLDRPRRGVIQVKQDYMTALSELVAVD